MRLTWLVRAVGFSFSRRLFSLSAHICTGKSQCHMTVILLTLAMAGCHMTVILLLTTAMAGCHMTVILLLTLAMAELIEYKSLVSQSPTASASMLGVYLFMELGVVDGGDVPYCVPPQKLHVHKHLLDCSEWGRGGREREYSCNRALCIKGYISGSLLQAFYLQLQPALCDEPRSQDQPWEWGYSVTI